MYSEKQLSDLKHTIPLWQVVADRVPDLTKKGKEYWCKCPLHSEDTASFSVFEKAGEWLFFCHGCQAKGNVIQFVQLMDKCSFQDAVEKLSNLAGWVKGKNQVEQTFQTFQKDEAKLCLDVSKLVPAEQARGVVDDDARRRFVALREGQ